MNSLITVLNIVDLLTAVVAVALSGSLLAPYFAHIYKAAEQMRSVPLVNTTLIFLEENKEVFIPIADAGKQMAFAIYSTAIAILKPVVKALVVILRIVKPYILFAANHTRIALRQIQQTGMSFTAAIQSMSEKLWDFGSSLAVVVKGFAYMVAYLTKGLSMVFSSFENVFQVGYRILFHTNQVTWNEVSSAFIPLVVVTAAFGFLYWMKRSKVTPVPQTPALRRSSRLARKRAMFSCGDLSAPASTGRGGSPVFASEKASSTTTASNL
jgi:hypothetical protein